MKRLFGSLALCCFALASAEDFEDPLAFVDPIAASAFLSGMGLQGVPEITAQAPAHLNGIESLDGLEYLGTSRIVNNAFSITNISFRSDEPVTSVNTRLASFLEGAGYVKVEQPGITNAGFKTRSRPTGNTFCSNQNGNATLRVREVTGVTVASIYSYPNGGQGCQNSSGSGYIGHSRLRQVLPELELPPGADMSANMNLGSSSSSRGGRSHATFTVDLTPAQVMAHFDQQMEAQGWAADSAWEGQQVSGSAWLRTDNNRSSAGVLTLVANNNKYVVTVEVQAMP